MSSKFLAGIRLRWTPRKSSRTLGLRLNSTYPQSLPFRPPPIRQRLRPLVPFFIYWCIITSLTVHLLRIRIRSKEEHDKAGAQISVLQGLIARYERGEVVDAVEVQRELEMVGLRTRTVLTVDEDIQEGKDVSWTEAIFGRRRKKADEDEKTVDEWAEGRSLFYLEHKDHKSLY